MSKTRQVFALPFRILRVVGIITMLIAGILMIGWYITWLDQYCFWRLVADILGFITFPLIPIVAIVEWLWHGWPTDITDALIFQVIGIVLTAVGYWGKRLILGQNSEWE
jgi:hypothetical protein